MGPDVPDSPAWALPQPLSCGEEEGKSAGQWESLPQVALTHTAQPTRVRAGRQVMIHLKNNCFLSLTLTLSVTQMQVGVLSAVNLW